jgi:hypothetical protein
VTVGVNSYLRKKSQRRNLVAGAKVGTAANGVTVDDDAIEVESIHLRLSPLRFFAGFSQPWHYNIGCFERQDSFLTNFFMPNGKLTLLTLDTVPMPENKKGGS